MKKIAIIILVFLFFPILTNAQENNFTVLITEVNFKNKNQDFIKFKVLSNTNLINLKGLTFYDDKNFKIINQDFPVKNNQEFTLTFNSTKSDSGNQLFTDHRGLTSTTEQIVISENNQILDLACWYQNPISIAEQKDFSKLQKQITLPNIKQSCFSSKKIASNQSVYRIKAKINTNSWKLPSIIITSSITKKRTKKSSSKIISLPKNSKLNLSNRNDLQINEFMPNPAGPDTNNEWIELINNSTRNINPNGYIIDDEDQGSKPYLIRKAALLKPNQVLLLPSQQTKIALGNTKDQVRLFSPKKKLIDQIDYQDSRENLSYAKISIDGIIEWQWSDSPTPGKPNPKMISIKGKINTPPNFNSIYYFSIIDSNNKKYLITFTENLIKAPLAKSLFTTGSIGTFTGILKSSNHLQLSNYEISKPASQNQNSPITWITIILLIIGGLNFLFKKVISHHPSS